MGRVEAVGKSQLIAKLFLESNIYKNCGQLMSYMSLGNEVDVTEISKQACQDKKKLAVPITNDKTCEIAACYVNPGTEFKIGAFSVMEPKTKELADIADIDVVLVPGIAFDRSGVRIGFGKGCYDRFLKNAEAVKVGVCYEFQVCDMLDCQVHDIKMDFLITEKGFMACNDKAIL